MICVMHNWGKERDVICYSYYLHLGIWYLVRRWIVNKSTDCIPNINYKTFRWAEAFNLHRTNKLNIDRISIDKHDYIIQTNIKPESNNRHGIIVCLQMWTTKSSVQDAKIGTRLPLVLYKLFQFYPSAGASLPTF